MYSMTSYLLMNIDELGAMTVSSRVLSVRCLSKLPFYKILLKMLREICDLISSHEY